MPSEFDMFELINQFRPMLISSMDIKDEKEEEFFKTLFGKESTKIPVFLESNSFEKRLGFTKLNTNNLYQEMDSLEDYENEDVVILAKIISKKNVNENPVVVYDIMKDLFSLSRGLRRQMGQQEIEGLENIKIEKDFVTLDVLAIYQ